MISPTHSPTKLSQRTHGRILLDGSATFALGLNSGIQRVVRNFVRHASRFDGRLGVETLPVVCAEGAFHPIDPAELGVWEVGARGQKSPSGTREVTSPPIDPGPGDVLVLLEGGRRVRTLREAVRSWRRAGARIGLFVHDLLPLSRPECFPEETRPGHVEWLRWAADNVDFFVANSETTGRAARRFLGDGPRSISERPLPGGVVHLGCDLDRPSRRPGGTPRTGDLRFLERFAASSAPPLFLTVGTLEPRKNHRRILDAFEAVWRRGGDAVLLCVGREGWLANDLLERIARHPERERRLFHRAGLDDAELEQCLQRATAMVCASLDEGFDLPLVEGLAHGLPVLASDIDVHREVGGPFCRYFDPGDSTALAHLIESLGPNERVDPALVERAGVCRSWEARTGELLERALGLAG